MRDRSSTPFFPLCWGEEAPTSERQSPAGSRAARDLEGTLVGDGRFLLLRKKGHEAGWVRFAARDLLGGIEVDVEIAPDPADPSGFRLGRARLVTREFCLPDLYDPPITRELVCPAPVSQPVRSLWRALRDKLGS